MKLYLLLALVAVAAATPSLEQEHHTDAVFTSDVSNIQDRNFLADVLVRQLISYLRHIVQYGSVIFKIPPLDPLVLDHYNLIVPAQIINLDLDLKNIVVAGLGGFVFHTSTLNLADLTFDIKLSVPRIDIGAEEYELVGDLYSAIPLFGKGQAKFQVDDFTISAKIFLKRSADGRAVVIDRIENASFQIPALKSQLTGVIGGGDIDNIVNAITEDVIVNYLNKFQGAIARIVSSGVVTLGNPFLEQLNTWRFIAPLIPRSNE